jgi:hypothetical protein
MPEGIHAAPQIDHRASLVLDRLKEVDELTIIDNDRLTLASMRRQLRWSEELNMAVLPERAAGPGRERQFRIFAAHSTTEGSLTLEPRLSFDDVPTEHRRSNRNVYGTGLYVANRPEAALMAHGAEEGRTIGAFLSEPMSKKDIVDRRRGSFLNEVVHLVGMVGTEMLLPGLMGEERAARRHVEKANEEWEELGAKLVLLNEAPRRRAEKMDHEEVWQYATVPPQYGLLRVSMTRIGTFLAPEEAPQRRGAAAMYGKLFWQAALRNARDMKRLGAPRQATSRG